MEPKEIHPKAEAQADTPASLPTDRPTAESCAEQLPLPRALKDWLICVRKPALSLRYRMEKRHVPDLDAEPAVRGDSAATSAGQADTTTPVDTSAVSRNAPSDAPEAADSPSAPKAPVKGKNSDLMTVTGGFTIRYFDLAVGMLGMLLAGCLFRGCCWMKRQMK
jgi:hypothetical protein